VSNKDEKRWVKLKKKMVKPKKIHKKSIRIRDDVKKTAAPAMPKERKEKAPAQKQPPKQADDIPEMTYLKTEVPGFDEMITNGIPQGSAVLLCGGPGTGKTTFSLQLMTNAAKKGKRCLYLTFEEDIISLKRHMKDYGWTENPGLKDNIIIKKMQP
jgi:predicted ATP-dependent serine protease